MYRVTAGVVKVYIYLHYWCMYVHIYQIRLYFPTYVHTNMFYMMRYTYLKKKENNMYIYMYILRNVHICAFHLYSTICIFHDIYFPRYVIIMVIFKCYFSREHIALSHIKLCEHGIRKNRQIKITVHDEKSYMK